MLFLCRQKNIKKMKTTKIFITILIATLLFSCNKNFVNVNQPTQTQVLTTKAGLLGLAVGLRAHFSTTTYSFIVMVPGLSTRELGDINTYTTPAELVLGGTSLPDDNAGISGLWTNLLRDKGMAENILANVDAVAMDPGTKSGLTAYAKWFRAITLGYLVQNFKEVPIDNKLDGKAKFNSRKEVIDTCISLLQSAKADIAAQPVSTEFSNLFPNIDLPNVINAFLARYNLFAGNYAAAITAADAVDLTSKSVWEYDGVTYKNPIYMFADYNNLGGGVKAQANFGLTGKYIPEKGDGRIAFYLDSSNPIVEPQDVGGHTVVYLRGFFDSMDKSIPIYLPGEMLLIKAEAYAQLGDLGKAVQFINAVREKTNDVFGVDAGLGPWTGNATNKSDIMDEIFKQRSIELFMSGMRLEDSRRIHPNLIPPAAGSLMKETGIFILILLMNVPITLTHHPIQTFK